jgi:hypothetical protein
MIFRKADKHSLKKGSQISAAVRFKNFTHQNV